MILHLDRFRRVVGYSLSSSAELGFTDEYQGIAIFRGDAEPVLIRHEYTVETVLREDKRVERFVYTGIHLMQFLFSVVGDYHRVTGEDGVFWTHNAISVRAGTEIDLPTYPSGQIRPALEAVPVLDANNRLVVADIDLLSTQGHSDSVVLVDMDENAHATPRLNDNWKNRQPFTELWTARSEWMGRSHPSSRRDVDYYAGLYPVWYRQYNEADVPVRSVLHSSDDPGFLTRFKPRPGLSPPPSLACGLRILQQNTDKDDTGTPGLWSRGDVRGQSGLQQIFDYEYVDLVGNSSDPNWLFDGWPYIATRMELYSIDIGLSPPEST